MSQGHPIHGPFHDAEHGFPIRDDSALFERLVLEINQAGLSWLTVLRKRDNFRSAFDGYVLDKIAAYGKRDEARLQRDPGIIRNRLKIASVIENARRVIAIREARGSFAEWLDAHHPLGKEQWVRLFRKTLVFTGGEITNEFLVGTGYLPGAHEPSCPIYAKVARKNPPWIRTPARKLLVTTGAADPLGQE